MTRNYDSQRRDDTRPSPRNQSSGRYGDSRPPRPARPRLNRETVDRAWENGAPRDHADYHPRQTNERSSSQRPPYGRDGNAPPPNSRRPYSQGRGSTGYDNQGRGDGRPSSRPYGDGRDPRNRSFNDSERPYGNRNERPGGNAGGEQRPYKRYEDNQTPGRRYDDNRAPNQRPPRRYDDNRAPDQRPPRRYDDNRAPGYRPPQREYDNRAPSQRPPRRFDNDREPDRRPPRHEYNDRAARNEDQQHENGQRRDSSDFQIASSEDSTAEDGIAEGEQFQGDYERFNEGGEPPLTKRPASPQRQRKQHTTWSKQPKTRASRDEHKPRAQAVEKSVRQKTKRAAKAKPSPATRPWQKGYKWPNPQESKSED